MLYKKHCIRSFLLLLLLSIVSVGGFFVNVYGYSRIDVQKETSLTVSFKTEDANCEGMHFRVYRVADVSDTANFIVTKEFEGASISLQNLTEEQWKLMAQQLTDYIARTKATIVPLAEQQTDSNGVASFTGLTTGLYLVVGEDFDLERRVYTPIPFLVSLPGLNGERQWEYDMDAVVKYTLTTAPEQEPLPSTGEEQEIISFLFIGGSVITFLFLCLRPKAQKVKSHYRYNQ